jgi:hypothetical protein
VSLPDAATLSTLRLANTYPCADAREPRPAEGPRGVVFDDVVEIEDGLVKGAVEVGDTVAGADGEVGDVVGVAEVDAVVRTSNLKSPTLSTGPSPGPAVSDHSHMSSKG